MFEVDRLCVSYGQSQVVNEVSFAAAQNETIALMGRNGMGKSTLFKALMGVLPTRGGTIRLAQSELTGLPSHRRVQQGLAYVPQGRMIFPSLTVLENIQTGLEKSRSNQVPNELFELFPVLFEMRHRKGGNLSGGQ
ncbi:MAG: ATP-binding cassette domain-containing protein, partial [Candidatus Macondimonas sp.]